MIFSVLNYIGNNIKMNCFQTITQFINTEDEEYNSKKYNKNACHFFSLKTAKEFFKKKDMSKTCHESNIYFAINMNKLFQNHEMYFEDVIKFTDLSSKDICATSTELIETGNYSLDLIFPVTDKSYCLVILKNSKYFVVMHYDGKFYIRDCHEPYQYNFDSKNEMIEHLNEFYQFNQSIVVDGYAIPEFSSIEYIFIDKDFKFNLENLEDEKESSKTELKETEFGISISSINYDDLNSGNDKVMSFDKDSIDTNKYNLSTPVKKLEAWADVVKKKKSIYDIEKKYPDEDEDEDYKSEYEADIEIIKNYINDKNNTKKTTNLEIKTKENISKLNKKYDFSDEDFEKGDMINLMLEKLKKLSLNLNDTNQEINSPEEGEKSVQS